MIKKIAGVTQLTLKSIQRDYFAVRRHSPISWRHVMHRLIAPPNVALLCAVSLFNLVGPARAAQLLSPPLWTDVGDAGTCYLRNIGTTPVNVQVTLFSNNGIAPGDIVVDSCNSGPLAAGKTCVIFVQALPDDSWAACSVKTSNINVSKLRGNADLRHLGSHEQGFKVVVGEDLR
jgi:hypothetical protein